MPRDRLAELQKKSDPKGASHNVKKDPEQVRLFIGGEGDPIVILQTEVESITKDLDVMTSNLKLLKQQQKDISFKVIGNDAATQGINEIEDIIKKTARAVRRKLKVLGTEVEKSERDGVNTEASRIRKVQHMTLARMFTDVMTDYLESQEEYKGKCKNLMVKQIKIVNSRYTDQDIENMMQEENPAIFTGDLLEEQSRARQNLDEAKALNFQIRKVEQSIVEIHELFQDLASLVHEQGETITRIEDHVQSTVSNVGSGVKQLTEARKKQSSARKTKIIIIVVVLVVLAVVIGVIVGVNR